MTVDYTSPQQPTFDANDDTASARLYMPDLVTEVNGAGTITPELLHITRVGSVATMYFDASVPGGEQAALTALIGAHEGVFPEDVQKVELDAPKDTDGSYINRPKTTKTGWHYEPIALDYLVGVSGSLYNRDDSGNDIDDGTDYGDASMKFYDDAGAELTQVGSETDIDWQARLDTDCVKTVVDWASTYDFDIIGGSVQVIDPPVLPDRAYIWAVVAPDIPSYLGGSVPYFSRGFALHFFSDHQFREFDGRGTKSFAYDPTYYSHKIRFIVKHTPGIQTGIQLILNQFKA